MLSTLLDAAGYIKRHFPSLKDMMVGEKRRLGYIQFFHFFQQIFTCCPCMPSVILGTKGAVKVDSTVGSTLRMTPARI